MSAGSGPRRFNHVAVLMGGLSAEREVSLNSGKACAEALERAGYRVTRVDAGRDLAEQLRRARPDVCFNALHDEGILALADSPNAARLRSLDLTRNQISEVGAWALAESAGLTGLRSLRLWGWWVSNPARGILQARFGERVHFC